MNYFIPLLVFISVVSSHGFASMYTLKDDEHTCGHKLYKSKISHAPQMQEIHLQSEGAIKHYMKSSIYQPIRILFHTDYLQKDEPYRSCYNENDHFMGGFPSTSQITCTDNNVMNCWGICQKKHVMTNEKYIYAINEILPRIEKIFEETLRVIPMSRLSLLSTENRCGGNGGVIVPEKFKSPNNVTGVDVLVFVTARPTNAGVLGWATACQITAGLQRPIAGQINIDPSRLSAGSYPTESLVRVLVHEMIHLLGFDQDLFKYFKDENGRDYTNKPVDDEKKVFSNYYKIHQKFKFKNAVEAARAHFACPSIDGVYLEEAGGEGTAGSHWEQTLFYTELMVGALDVKFTYAFSNITLGLLDDTGWYKTNRSKAEYLSWGKGMGCDFYMKRCENWP
jgi:leishmanolysin